MALAMEMGLGPGHIVLDGDPAPSPQKRGQSPTIFRPFLLWPNGWMHQDAIWYGGRPRPRQRARWGPSSPPPPKGHSPFPIFGPCLLWPSGCMYQDTKLVQTMEVGLSLGHIVLDGDPAPSPNGAEPPIFGQCLLWPNGWMD